MCDKKDNRKKTMQITPVPSLPLVINRPGQPDWKPVPPKPVLKVTNFGQGDMCFTCIVPDMDGAKYCYAEIDHFEIWAVKLLPYRLFATVNNRDWSMISTLRPSKVSSVYYQCKVIDHGHYLYAAVAVDLYGRYSAFSDRQPKTYGGLYLDCKQFRKLDGIKKEV